MTADLETDIRAEMVRWTDTGASTTISIEPKESNFGVRMTSGANKDDVRTNIAVLLEWPYSIGAVGMGSVQIG